MLEGRAAAGDDEVMLSPEVAGRLGVDVGDVVALGVGELSVSVTGLVALAEDTRTLLAVLEVDALATLLDEVDIDDDRVDVPERLREAAVGWALAEDRGLEDELSGAGWSQRSRAELAQAERHTVELVSGGIDPGIAASLTSLALVGVVLSAVVLVVAQRERRELGLLAAIGVGPDIRRRFRVLQGFVTGLIATALGLVVGIAGAIAVAPLVQRSRFEIWGPTQFPVRWMVVFAVLGIGVPTLATVVATRGIGGDVMRSMRGEGPGSSPRRSRAPRWSFGAAGASFVLLGAGVLLAAPTLVLGGAVVGVAALLPACEWVLIRLGSRSSGSLRYRLAFRIIADAAGRTRAIVGVQATLSVSAALVLLVLSGEARDAATSYVPRGPDGSMFIDANRAVDDDTLDVLRDVLDDAPAIRLGIAAPSWPDDEVPRPSSWGQYGVATDDASAFDPDLPSLVVVEPEDLEILLDRPPDTDERDALVSGSVLTLEPGLLQGDTVRLEAPSPTWDTADDTLLETRLPAISIDAPVVAQHVPMAYIGSDTLDTLEAVELPADSFVYLPAVGDAFTLEQEDRAREALSRELGVGGFVLDVERGSDALSLLIRTIVGFTTALIVVGALLALVTMSLSIEELRPDLSSLAATGADRRFRATVTGIYAATVIGTGSLLGLAVGLLVAPAMLTSFQVSWSLTGWAGALAAAAAATGIAAAVGAITGRRIATETRRAY